MRRMTRSIVAITAVLSGLVLMIISQTLPYEWLMIMLLWAIYDRLDDMHD
jgi:hypothetical protein